MRAPAPPADKRRSLWERLMPHWPIVVALAVVAALVLWFVSYRVAQ
ncbi:MAG TPA: hypothetical protein VG370_32825 [Chloroflexota bacterium]|nr:hypothetical protein [Chloroflexota bacterium]